MFFKNFKVWETELAGRKLTLETGKMAGLANASIMARYGETEVLCTVTASAKPREGVDFFPLSVDYEENVCGRQNSGFIPSQRRQSRRKGNSYIPLYRPSYPSAFPKRFKKRLLSCCNSYVS